MFSVPTLQPAEISALSAMLIATIAICLYLLLWSSKRISFWIKQKWLGDRGEILYAFILKYAGLVLLGIIPGILFLLVNKDYTLSMIGLSANILTNKTIYAVLIVGTSSLLFTWFASRNKETFDHYPNIRIVHWDTALLIKYIFSWVIYMLGYEFLFRGLLFLPLAKSFGFFTAAAITTMLYAATHLVKGARQTAGCFIYGPLLCFITWNTQTIYAAWIIHSCLVVGNTLAALVYHPTFKYSVKLSRVQG